MKRSVRFLIVLSALLLAVSSAQANTITASLDNPPNGEGITGNGTINGWALATNGADVEVHPRIDGTTQEDVIIPCCGPRQDVANAVEGAPLNTGYAGSINYALLGAGQHTVGVEIRAEGCDPIIIENTVEVTTPGNVELVPEFSWWDARSAVDDMHDELIVVNAATGASPHSHDFESLNLRIDYSLAGQNTGIVESWSEDEETHERWDAVQTILPITALSAVVIRRKVGQPLRRIKI